MSERKVIKETIDLTHYGESRETEFSLQEIKNVMETRKDSILFIEGYAYISYTRLETDSEFAYRIRMEDHDKRMKEEPEYREYLKLKERYQYVN